MPNFSKPIKYIVISPVRDEERHMEATIRSVISQTILPTEWIIVDDGSSDHTPEIVKRFVDQFHWMHLVRRTDRGHRKSGGGVIEAFNDGLNSLHSTHWDYIVKLDGDLSFAADYFENCFEHFDADTRLGVGGGDIYHEDSGIQKREINPKFHVRGATKIYRRACWEAIGGLMAAPGWDTIDEVKANMLGWRSCTFSELHLIHHRPTGTAEGVLRDRVKHGVACYVSGYHPMFVAASCMARLGKKPYLLGSAAIGYGFLKAYWGGVPRVRDPRFIRYIRAQQLRRLVGLNTIWR